MTKKILIGVIVILSLITLQQGSAINQLESQVDNQEKDFNKLVEGLDQVLGNMESRIEDNEDMSIQAYDMADEACYILDC
jgi:ABC-type transporter Mla subunit MlaD